MQDSRALPRFLGLSFFMNVWVISAVLLMVLNDHFLKQRFGNILTGKISDFCGVFFLPLFLCAISLLLMRVAGKPQPLNWRWLIGAIIATDIFFVALNLWPWFHDSYVWVQASIGLPSRSTMDATDLVALVMNPVTYFFARRYF